METRSFNLSLGGDLRAYVENRSSSGLYATPSEYMRDLIRRDMQDQDIVEHVLLGLADIQARRLSDLSITDILDEA